LVQSLHIQAENNCNTNFARIISAQEETKASVGKLSQQQELLSKRTAKLETGLAAIPQQTQAIVSASVAPLLAKAEEQERRMDSFEREFEKMQKQVAISDSTHRVERRPTGPTSPESFDQTILVANGHNGAFIGSSELRTLVAELAAEANISPDQYSIEGAAVQRRYNVQFTGSCADTAGRRVLALFSVLKDRKAPDGYRELFVVAPNGVRTKCFLGLDRSQADMRMSFTTGVLARTLEELYPEVPFTVRKKAGLLLVHWNMVAEMDRSDPARSTVKWATDGCAAAGIDAAVADVRFRAALAAANYRP
jgi:hypothetical protein